MAKTKKEIKKEVKITKKVMNQVFIRNLFGLQWGWNYEAMQGLGYCFVIMPVLKLLYRNDPEKMKEALITQISFFNTNQAMSHLIIGADIAIQEELGLDTEAITGLKTGLMGPFAGVGDTIFLATFRAIFFSIAAYLALDGYIVGLLIPVVATIGVIFVRYKFTWLGYEQGKRIATTMGKQMDKFIEGASILGLTVVGALVPSVIGFKLNWDFVFGEVTLNLQGQLDKIMPGLVPLGIVFLSYWLLGKKKMTSTKLLIILFILGIILGNIPNWVPFIQIPIPA